MTAPLPIAHAPVIISKGSNGVWVKWYPAPYGAYRFLVQTKIEVNANASSTGIYIFKKTEIKY